MQIGGRKDEGNIVFPSSMGILVVLRSEIEMKTLQEEQKRTKGPRMTIKELYKGRICIGEQGKEEEKNIFRFSMG